MKRKYIYGVLGIISVIILVSILVKYKYDTVSITVNSSKNISLRDKDTIKLINTFKEPNGMYSTITGNENTYNGYNTVYCTLILNEIGIKTDNNIINSIKKQSLFKDTNQDILNEMEKTYYANIILKNNKTTIPYYIKEDLKKIIKSDYHKDGYFISSNYVKYKDRPDFLLTKLNNTMLVLRLAKEFNLMNTIDENTIILWLNSVLRDKTTNDLPGKIYYISTCLNLLNKSMDINNKIVIDTRLFENINDISALTQIQQYLLLCKEYSQKIDTPSINALKINLAASLKYKSNDPQVTYKKILILKMLNYKYNSKHIAFLIKSDEYKSAFFPNISKFQYDYKQTYIYVSTLLMLNQKSDIDSDSIKNKLISIKADTLNEILKSDPYEIYAIVQLNNILNLNALGKEVLNNIKQTLLNTDTKQLNKNNLLFFSHKTMILKSIGYTFHNTYLPNNNDTILEDILKNKGEFKDNKILQLIYLDTLINSGYDKSKLTKFGDYVNNIKADINDENETYLLYCKCIFLKYIGYKLDKQNVYKSLEYMQTNIGYGANIKSSFFDPRMTLLCQQLKMILENKKTDNYMLLLN
ncbi:hypothetical protein [Clostridium estertheticum]|uniref:hypothetical protein n=1 Tax=Clostridium estertheticum TaxID=238834 RepID=UPI001C7E17AA|nr:hypothetical protein [Clostridium estertheticum]MBX4267523.1 hypothetical protein [Clostridium estertheticum]WLC91332.1 hypothetical protein KTC95_24160 [Clostridium estertheticum]